MLRAIKTNPPISGYFRAETVSTAKFIYYPLQFTKNSFGVVNIDGNNIYFDTYANAVDFFQDPNSNGNASASLVEGELYKDMGKTVNIFVGQYRSDNIQHVATLTKVQKIENTGQATEGITGKQFSSVSPPPVGNNYATGYIVTWSTNPDATAATGIPVGAMRTGHQ